jgi:hypothetical protein
MVINTHSGAAQVINFDENDLKQDSIPNRAFYIREFFDYKKKRATVRISIPLEWLLR